MPGIDLLSAIPVLPTPSIETSVSFYAEKLGFSCAFQYPDAAGVQRGPVQIHFWLCEDPEIPKVTACRVNVRGIDALYEEMRKQGVVHPNGALADKPWGFREFTVLDFCGNGIVFAEPHKTRG